MGPRRAVSLSPTALKATRGPLTPLPPTMGLPTPKGKSPGSPKTPPRRASQSPDASPHGSSPRADNAGNKRSRSESSSGDDPHTGPGKRQKTASVSSSTPASQGSGVVDPSPRPDDDDLVKQRNIIRKTRRQAAPLNHSGKFWKFPKELPSKESKGMVNPGNFCYRNSVLQALFHAPAFYRYLGKIHYDCDLEPDMCVLCALQALLYGYWNDPGVQRNPSKPKTVAQSLLDRFNAACLMNLPFSKPELAEEIQYGYQADAYEFLQYLLVEQVYLRTLPSDPWSFEGQFMLHSRASWTCKDCGETSTRDNEPEFGLSFSPGVHVRLSLETLLEREFNNTRPTFCESTTCGPRFTKAYKNKNNGPVRVCATRITNLPMILIIQVRIFVQDNEREYKRELSVPFPQKLDLGKYLHTSVTEPGVYRLDGAVAHIGKTIRSGHYIAGVRKHGRYEKEEHDPLFDEGPEDRFQVVNDQDSIHQSYKGSMSEMCKPRPRQFDYSVGQPFILVYSKCL